MSVSVDFTNFRSNYLIPAPKAESISYRYKRITRQLNTDFWNTTSEVAHSLYAGSYGRNTAAKGLSDLDIVFELPSALYSQYDGYATNGQSALLQAVKKSIRNTYSTSETFGDGQVVVIQFDDGMTFEVLPGFRLSDGSYKYPNANGGGSWKNCNPRAEQAALATRNSACAQNLYELCRMSRIWKDYCSVPISGMLIDTLAYQFMEKWEYRDKSYAYYDYMCRDFFAFLASQDQKQDWWRAPGSASWVGRQGVFENKARSAELRAREAVKFDQDDKAWSRRQKWREVFGSLYPDK